MRMRMQTAIAIGLATTACAVGWAYAQAQPEVVVRQGDTIEWVLGPGSPPHKVRFGANGATPSVAELMKDVVEKFDPPLDANGDGPVLNAKTTLKATIRANAVPGKVFTFTCGFHPPQMLSLPFTVAASVAGQPPRTHRVIGETGLHWHVHVDTTP